MSIDQLKQPIWIGLIWSFLYIGLESTQSVFFGSALQSLDSFLLGLLVFGVTTTLLSAGIFSFNRQQFSHAQQCLIPLIACNLSTAAGWVLYLIAIQLIEPAVAFTVSSAAMPIAAIVFAHFSIGEPEHLDTVSKRFGMVMIIFGMLFLGLTILAGYSGFVRGGFAVGLGGLLCAIGSGAAFSLMLVYCRALDNAGLSPTAVFAFRFFAYFVIAFAGWLLQLEYKGPVESNDLIRAVLIGLIIMAVPLFAMQKAIASVSVFLLSSITALGPFLVFGFQLLEGRVEYSLYTLIGLLTYSLGAMITVLSLIRHESEN